MYVALSLFWKNIFRILQWNIWPCYQHHNCVILYAHAPIHSAVPDLCQWVKERFCNAFLSTCTDELHAIPWMLDCCLIMCLICYNEFGGYNALQSQKAVTAYFTSEQLLSYGFAWQYTVTSVLCASPSNTIHWPNDWSMLGQRRNRWTNIDPLLCYECVSQCCMAKIDALLVASIYDIYSYNECYALLSIILNDL